jgi:hypothetical protein
MVINHCEIDSRTYKTCECERAVLQLTYLLIFVIGL